MKTEVIMKRELFGQEISQKSKTQFFSATDLAKAGNRWRMQNNLQPFNMSEWLRNKNTIEFIKRLEIKFGDIKISGNGRKSHTWVHPYLFIDMALAISPDLKIEVYGWLFDKLIEYRNHSGDSYKKMAGALFDNTKSKTQFYKEISDVAILIKKECGVKGWETATENQLKLRDKIHEYISLLCDVISNNNEVVKIGILKAKKELNKN